jgi:AcrR family transcriptional regulator
MAPADRRRAIVEALVPLLVERGGEVSTREIAQAAGIAEGTIFRVFDDKKSLMLAAAEEAINPADGQAAFDEAMAADPELRAQVVAAARRILDRMRMTMAVMMAVRSYLWDDEAHRQHHEGKHFGPPPFVMEAQAQLHRRLTGLFEPHRAELAVEPEVAALALRSLVFGASRPELGMVPALDAEQIADLLLQGITTRTTDHRSTQTTSRGDR